MKRRLISVAGAIGLVVSTLYPAQAAIRVPSVAPLPSAYVDARFWWYSSGQIGLKYWIASNYCTEHNITTTLEMRKKGSSTWKNMGSQNIGEDCMREHTYWIPKSKFKAKKNYEFRISATDAAAASVITPGTYKDVRIKTPYVQLDYVMLDNNGTYWKVVPYQYSTKMIHKNGAKITKYQVKYRAEGGTWKKKTSKKFKFTLTGFTPAEYADETTFDCFLRAYNKFGWGPWTQCGEYNPPDE